MGALDICRFDMTDDIDEIDDIEEDDTDDGGDLPEEKQWLKSVGAQLALVRKMKNISQKEVPALSVKVGVKKLTRRTVSDLETGNNGSVLTIRRYAQVLGVKTSLIFARADHLHEVE